VSPEIYSFKPFQALDKLIKRPYISDAYSPEDSFDENTDKVGSLLKSNMNDGSAPRSNNVLKNACKFPLNGSLRFKLLR